MARAVAAHRARETGQVGVRLALQDGARRLGELLRASPSPARAGSSLVGRFAVDDEALVERELFEKRQATAKTRAPSQVRAAARPVNDLLSRLIRCGQCRQLIADLSLVDSRDLHSCPYP